MKNKDNSIIIKTFSFNNKLENQTSSDLLIALPLKLFSQIKDLQNRFFIFNLVDNTINETNEINYNKLIKHQTTTARILHDYLNTYGDYQLSKTNNNKFLNDNVIKL